MSICIVSLMMLVFVSCKQGKEPAALYSGKNYTEEALFEEMEANEQWPSYRGFLANGYMKRTVLPDSFNVETGYNVKWNVAVPGLGLSCPVIWDDKVFITTAISELDDEGYLTGMYGDVAPVEDSSAHRWILYCFDKKSGELIWEEQMHEGIPAVKRHPKSSHANTSVATNGEYVVAFLGSEGLYCYDMEGKQVWKKDFGLIMSAWNVMESAEWEFTSSPVIFEDRVIVQADGLNRAFVAVLELETGNEIWKKERDEIANWCTPNVYYADGKARVVVNGFKHRGAYDMETGEEIWWMNGGGDIPVPTPVVWKDLVYFNSAHGRNAPLMAVKNTAEGKVSYPRKNEFSEDFAWFYNREGAYMTSVVVYDSLLYRLRWNGNLACYDARSGEEVFSQTVNPYSFIASPVIAGGKMYLVSEEGMVYVVKVGREYELLGKYDLGEVSLVTPGLVRDMIVFRTAGRLIGVGA